MKGYKSKRKGGKQSSRGAYSGEGSDKLPKGSVRNVRSAGKLGRNPASKYGA